MFFVKDPGRFGVIVTSNLFGDILTDLGAAITGGMGLAAGANLNPPKKYPSMFEPIHGSAPDIAGRQLANPLAAVWSASQMLDHLGHPEAAARVLSVMERHMAAAKILTPDMGGIATTAEVGEAIVKRLRSL
jgi:tartrate dehydrogenase/decarboxylase/D-malate dehydrogenase